MAIVVLPPTLTSRLESPGPFRVAGRTAGEALRALEKNQPKLKGWILDEAGKLREHVAIFVASQRVNLGRPLDPDDELFVIQAISGGAPEQTEDVMTELLVGTRKGLFVLRGRRGAPLRIAQRLFVGQTVDFACHDSRSGTYFAACTHGQFGPHLFMTRDLEQEWQEVEGLAFPGDAGVTLERIWIVTPGAANGELWAGVAPAALFHSSDDGRSWQLVEGLWNEPTRPDWEGGLGGLALHSICPWPGDPEKLAVGISAAGVWLTDDAGQTWRRGVQGLVPRYLPEEARGDTLMHCIHKLRRSPTEPTTLYLQYHTGVYRSDDAGETWVDIGTDRGLPAEFGFPILVDPANAARALVIPLVADWDRVTPDGKVRVYETRDRGASWQPLDKGLPGENAYLTVLRQAMCCDRQDPLGLYFGTESGSVFASADSGDSWYTLAEHLPPIVSLEMGA